MPPEKRKARRFGSFLTMSAPRCAPMMSAMAASRVLSFRGSARIEPGVDRPSQRVRCLQVNFATSLGSVRNDRLCDAELRAFGQPPLGLGGRAQTPGQADLAEARHART